VYWDDQGTCEAWTYNADAALVRAVEEAEGEEGGWWKEEGQD
jgi:hypothetical protein